jgi:hypothetical protein
MPVTCQRSSPCTRGHRSPAQRQHVSTHTRRRCRNHSNLRRHGTDTILQLLLLCLLRFISTASASLLRFVENIIYSNLERENSPCFMQERVLTQPTFGPTLSTASRVPRLPSRLLGGSQVLLRDTPSWPFCTICMQLVVLNCAEFYTNAQILTGSELCLTKSSNVPTRLCL